MMRTPYLSRLLTQGSAGAVLLVIASASTAQVAPPASTSDSTQATPTVSGPATSVDFTAGLGYATNPLLRGGSDTGSGFGRLSALVSHTVVSERSALRLTAFGENNTYFSHNGSKQLFALGAHDRYKASEKVSVFGDLGFSSDIGGQLVGRILGVPSVPPVIDPGTVLPPPVTIVDPFTIDSTRRQYRFTGQVGADIALNARDSLDVSASGQYAFFQRNGPSSNYSSFSQSVEFRRTLSERTSVGARLTVQEANYPGSSNGSTLYNPAATVRTRLGEGWDASLAVGVLIVDRHTLSGNSTKLSPSVDAALCRTSPSERICAHASHSAQTASTQGTLTTTSAGVDYFSRLSPKDTVQASASVLRYSGGNILVPGTGRSTYYTATGSLDHRFAPRLSAGGELTFRKVDRSSSTIRGDGSAVAFVRYRLGNLR